MKKILSCACVIAFVCVCGPLCAQETAEVETPKTAEQVSEGPRILEKLLERRRASNVLRMDTNNDGRVDDLERINYRSRRLAEERKAIESDPEYNSQDLLDKERERADRLMREMRDGHIARVAEYDRRAKMTAEERAALDPQLPAEPSPPTSTSEVAE